MGEEWLTDKERWEKTNMQQLQESLRRHLWMVSHVILLITHLASDILVNLIMKAFITVS